MGVMCQILLDRTEDGVFKAGGLVTGTLKYFIDKPTQYRRISLCFVGKGECQWSESDSDSDDNDSTDYSNCQEYFTQVIMVYLGTNNKDLISGAFEYPFQFLLPNDIPPSFKDDICKIKYKITVTFAKANFMKTNKHFDVEIPMTSYVNPCSLEPMMFSLKKDLISLKTPNKVEIKGEISKTCVAPGDSFEMILTVNNDSNISVFIRTELVSRVTYVSSSNRKKVDEEIVKNTCIMKSVATNGVTSLTHMVPTYPNLYSIQHTKVMVREYKVKITAKLPFPHIDAVLDIPVAIGSKQHELLVPAAVYNQYDKEPPPYSSISAQNEDCANRANDDVNVKKCEEADSSKGEKKKLDADGDQDYK
ncbi:uncharacterized protein LOC111348384 [Spodoptera litura]|uniref:Uncharacterized protein LOC111348384 n=1 Tax=Spodoptera litura TaxID=69820 RepID=A0A9J7IKU8_SPOLT|nr:uncharacterized protein LOC111348384 [Spodoptera litura]